MTPTDGERVARSWPRPFPQPGVAGLAEVERAAWLEFNQVPDASGDRPSRLLVCWRMPPETVPLCAAGHVVTYAQLHDRAEALATHLRDSGMRPGTGSPWSLPGPSCPIRRCSPRPRSLVGLVRTCAVLDSPGSNGLAVRAPGGAWLHPSGS